MRNNVVVATGADQQFTTAAAAPSVTTTAATGVTQTGATLTGLVDANGTQTEFRFEYGPDTNYGTLTTPASGGSAVGGVSRGTSIAGLTAGTTYHYRVLALRNSVVVATGADQTFTTLAAATPSRPSPSPSPSGTATATATPSASATATPTVTATPTLGGTPTPTPTPLPIEPTAVNLSPRLKLNKKRSGTVRFSATPTGAVGMITIKTLKKGKRKAFRIGTSPYTIPASGTVTVTIGASKKAYKKLGKRPGKKAKATATLKHGGKTFTLPILVRR